MPSLKYIRLCVSVAGALLSGLMATSCIMGVFVSEDPYEPVSGAIMILPCLLWLWAEVRAVTSVSRSVDRRLGKFYLVLGLLAFLTFGQVCVESLFVKRSLPDVSLLAATFLVAACFIAAGAVRIAWARSEISQSGTRHIEPGVGADLRQRPAVW
jgi:uncharacterized membrane protein HdeD (DUF308 family)